MFQIGEVVLVKIGRRMNAGRRGLVVENAYEGVYLVFEGDSTRYWYFNWELE